MASTTDSTTRTTETLSSLRGQALDQIHDRRLADTGITELRFCEQSGTDAWNNQPRPMPEVIWAD